MEVSDYQPKKQLLLDYCLKTIDQQTEDAAVTLLLQMALKKSITTTSRRPSPPLYGWLLAEDLGCSGADWLLPLTAACGFFYASADLFDDIQDRDPRQPVIQAAGTAQAINIANMLLMQVHSLLLELPLDAGLRLKLLQLFVESCRIMSLGQYYDIDSTNRATLAIDPAEIVPRKAGAEFACFVAAAALAAGAEGPFAALGGEMGALLQIFTDYYDIWVPQPAKALSQDLAIHKNSFPLHWARKDPDWGETAEAWLAGRAGTAGRQWQLRRMLAQTLALEQFRAYIAAAAGRVEGLFAALPPLPRLQALWAEEAANARVLCDSLFELRQRTLTPRAEFARQEPVATALARGLEYLCFVPGYRDVWEMQRSGFLGEELLTGNLFNPLLVLETLLDAGRGIGPELEELLARRGPDGWHYYTDSMKIPPDSDDLGQILQLAGRTGLARTPELAAQLKYPLEVLEANLAESGFCPTWLCDELHFKREDVGRFWFGNDCPGVIANLYYGLAHYDRDAYAVQIRRGADYLAERFDAGRAQWPDVYYHSHQYVAYLVARLYTLIGFDAPLLDAVQARLLDEQALDGSWNGQPQATAFALLFFAALPARQNRLRPAAALRARCFLLDTQEHDGSWAGEPFFVRPGREGAFESFQHPRLATAFVLRALLPEAAHA